MDTHNSHLIGTSCLENEKFASASPPVLSQGPHWCPTSGLPQQRLPPNLMPKPEKTHVSLPETRRQEEWEMQLWQEVTARHLYCYYWRDSDQRLCRERHPWQRSLWTTRIPFYGFSFKKTCIYLGDGPSETQPYLDSMLLYCVTASDCCVV